MPLNTDYDIGAAFRVIEEELIASMMRNMKRHFQEETQLDMDWTAWQAEQLYALDQYKRRTEKKYGKEFYHLNERMEELIRQANASGRMDQELEILEAIRKGMDLHRQKGSALRFFKVNDRKLNALIKATRADMEKAETAVLRMSQDRYRQIIFNAQVYANTGAGTYEKAVDMATKDFMMAGLNCVQYKNGARHTLSDYADMAIRTAAKRAYLQGEGEMRQEWGIHTVIINKRSDNPCPKCLPFVGKVMIDDVWSGGSRKDGDYPLMSEAVAAGLYHPRCKDSHTTYFPGISTPPGAAYTKREILQIEKRAKEEAEEQWAMDQEEKWQRVADTRLDAENRQTAEARTDEWDKKSEELTERRKKRLAERKQLPKTAEDSGESKIVFDFHGKDDRYSGAEGMIRQLEKEYKTRLRKVTTGAEKGAGDVDMSGATMRLNNSKPENVIHEFAHSIANSMADKYGLTEDVEFWKEIKAIRRRYRKDVGDDTSRWISAYANTAHDEFFAEAFAHAKMRELGLPIPGQYGTDFTYSQQVLDTVNKYFGKPDINEKGFLEKGRLTRISEKQLEEEKLRALLQSTITIGSPYIDPEKINSTIFREKFSKITNSSKINDRIRSLARGNLTRNNGTYTEMLDIIDINTGESVIHKLGKKNALDVSLTVEERATVRAHKGKIIGMHNHPTNIFPTGSDFVTAGARGYDFGVVITHDLRVFKYTPPKKPVDAVTLDRIIDKCTRMLYDDTEKSRGFERAMQELERRFGITWQEM